MTEENEGADVIDYEELAMLDEIDIDNVPSATEHQDIVGGQLNVDKYYLSQDGKRSVDFVLNEELIFYKVAERTSSFANSKSGTFVAIAAIPVKIVQGRKKVANTKKKTVGFNVSGDAPLVRQLNDLKAHGVWPVKGTIEKVKAKGSGSDYYQLAQS